ncbi:nucleoside/nucleotide kinase family protein [Oryzihumus sp.]|uniref:nucleoside/nucleotide kinase family protein n=1 Tax=Oryzihumus sp. TaxID=1968903 RepID=UPI002ED77C13
MTDVAALAERARGLVPAHGRVILGIAGAPGAGKSTLVEELLAALRRQPPPGVGGDWLAHVPMDGFHLADVQLERLGNRRRKGAPDTFDSAGYLAALQRIADNGEDTVYVPGFERTLEKPIAAAIAVPPQARLVVTEGNYLLLQSGHWPQIRALLREVWFVDLPDATRRERLVARHVAFGKEPDAAVAWVDGPDEANARAVSQTARYADLVIGGGDPVAGMHDASAPGQAGAELRER